MRIFLLLFLLMTSCNKFDSVAEKSTNTKFVDYEDAFFPDYYSEDTLCLDVMLYDCGEWGGPKDKFRIYVDSLHQYRLQYKRYRFNCDSIHWFYGKDQPLEFEKEINLNKHNKQVVSDFLLG